MKDAWPVEAKASGGRHYRGNNVDQNFDTYSVEYTFADGTKLHLEGRTMPGCDQRVRQLRPRLARARRSSRPAATPRPRCKIFKGQKIYKVATSRDLGLVRPRPTSPTRTSSSGTT